MHRDIGVAQDLLGRVVFGVARCDADIDIDVYPVAAERERLGDAPVDPSRNLLRLADSVEVSKDYRELVSADPGDRVVRIDHPAKTFRRDHQDLVADRMTETVVYILEAPDIQEQHL